MQSQQQRLPRFTRDPEAAGSFQFTKRDLELLRHVAEHRFIRSEWLVKLVGGSKQQVLRRLNLLYHHGYLDRPRAQLDYFHNGGSKTLVYGLASRGAGRLRRDLNIPFDRMDWTTRNKRVGRLFIEHTLMISDFMAALELDCRKRSGVRLLYPHDLPKLNSRQNSQKSFRWAVDLPGMRRVGVVPDKVFALEVVQSHGRIGRTQYFLEVDRGTMPIERRDLRRSCVMRKLSAYRATLASAHLRHTLKLQTATILIVVDSSSRAAKIQSRIEQISPKYRASSVVYHPIMQSDLVSVARILKHQPLIDTQNHS